LVEDAQAKVKIEEMREGVFEEILPLQLAHEAKILFDKVKRENNLVRTNDLMSLYVYVLYWIEFHILTKDFFKIYKKGEDMTPAKVDFLNAVKKIQSTASNFMISFQKELAMSRDKRMVKATVGIDQNKNSWSLILSKLTPPKDEKVE